MVLGMIFLQGAFAGMLWQIASPPEEDHYIWFWDEDSSPVFELVMVEGIDWTEDEDQANTGAPDISHPDGWRWTGNSDTISWEVIDDGDPDTVDIGVKGFFSVKPGGNTQPVAVIHEQSENGGEPVEIIVPQVVVPEASTMALLGLGLFAGVLLKRRKK
jgi:hypothetical protein